MDKLLESLDCISDSLKKLTSLYEADLRAKSVIKECHAPWPKKTIRIESVEQLRRESVSERQIAAIYQFKLPTGQGDTAAFQKCEENDPDELERRRYVNVEILGSPSA